MAIRDDSESVQITKCSLDDLLMSLKANKMALNSAVYMEEMKKRCFRPLLCTLFRLNWAKQTPGIMRQN